MDPIIGHIMNQVSSLVDSEPFRDWLVDQRLDPGDHIIINNSFLYREKKRIKTKKSNKYLAIPIDDRSGLNLDDIRIIIRSEDTTQNKDFAVMKKTEQNVLPSAPLHDSVSEELKLLGKIVFLLIGEIEDNLILSQPFSCGLYRTVVLDSSISEDLVIKGDQVRVRDISNPDSLWSKLEALSIGNGSPTGLRARDRKSFVNAVSALAKEQHGALRLPGTPVSNRTLLDQIANSLTEQADEYAASLCKYQGNPGQQSEFNNILRIAYNFDSEASTIISLLMSVSDIKPLLFWCTVFDHWQLYRAFEALPWLALGLKPSLKDYGESIKAARNSRFHHLLPINKKLEANLDGVMLKARRLILFDRYSPRGQTANDLDYEDKELIEVLLQFTHAEERDVTDDFWVRNLDIIRSTARFVSSTASALKLLLASSSKT